jgi:pilus assembly protein CpaB
VKRRSRTALVVTITLATAGLASFAVYRAVERIPVREVEVASKYLVVAARPMPMGTAVGERDVKLVAWPARDPIAGSYSEVKAVANRGLIASVAEDEPITETKLAPLEAGSGLPPSIPSGMRAISVKVNEVIGVAGFVVPGTRVDVVVTVRPQTQQDSMARIVVSNVQVLTAGTRYDQEQAKDGKPIPSTVVTLLVSPSDSERIALASTEGQITLSLRNPLDQQPSDTHGIRTTGLMGEPNAPPVQKVVGKRVVMVAPPPPSPPPPVPEPPYLVEMIRAAKRTEEPVRK